MNASWASAERILAVRLDQLGDVLMTEPALAALRGGGRRHVTLLTSRTGSALGPLLPSVDDVIGYDAPWMKVSARRDPGADLVLVERLRAGRFDAAVIFTVNTQSALPAALLTYLAGIPLRAARVRERPYQLLTDWVEEDEPDLPVRHEVERQLSLVRRLGFAPRREGMAVRVAAHHRSQALSSLRRAGIRADEPWLLLHPGASAPSRRYPAESFAAAARRLVREDGWQLALVGDAGDRELVERVHASIGPAGASVVTDLDLGGLAAATAMASVFIGNNSGPMHLAAAVGTPTVVTYALTNVQHTPWRVPCRVLTNEVPCRNCLRSVCPVGHHACLRGIRPAAIVDAVRELAATPRKEALA